MFDASDRPLVTYHVIAYNQARFIREAVRSALAQTYTPMEILLSDDCSSDGTFEIMQELANDYTGPHTVVLRQNERNLGLSEHTNRVVARARGELIIAADGDDVSDPRRAERCVEAWLKNGRPAAIASSVSCIDADGRPSRRKDGRRWFAQFRRAENETVDACLLRFSQEGSPRLVTCAAAWTKEMFEAFGPLPPDVWHEDDIITLRAWLFDQIVFMDDELVQYREHDSNLFNRADTVATTWQARRQAEEAWAHGARRRRISLLGFLPDLEVAVEREWITPVMRAQLARHVELRCASFQIMENWWKVAWRRRVASFCVLLWLRRRDEVRWCGPRLLPLPVFLAVGAAWSRARTIAGMLSSAWLTVESVHMDAVRALCGA